MHYETRHSTFIFQWSAFNIQDNIQGSFKIQDNLIFKKTLNIQNNVNWHSKLCSKLNKKFTIWKAFSHSRPVNMKKCIWHAEGHSTCLQLYVFLASTLFHWTIKSTFKSTNLRNTWIPFYTWRIFLHSLGGWVQLHVGYILLIIFLTSLIIFLVAHCT